MLMGRRFIQKAIRRPGSLRRQLEIPKHKNIPPRLLNKIISAKAGQTIINPTGVGKRRVKVTRLIERRAILAKSLRRLR